MTTAHPDLAGKVLYAAATDDAGLLMVITDDPHDCGWPERISYIDPLGNITRSGCAGCEAERPIVRIPPDMPPTIPPVSMASDDRGDDGDFDDRD